MYQAAALDRAADRQGAHVLVAAGGPLVRHQLGREDEPDHERLMTGTPVADEERGAGRDVVKEERDAEHEADAGEGLDGAEQHSHMRRLARCQRTIET